MKNTNHKSMFDPIFINPARYAVILPVGVHLKLDYQLEVWGMRLHQRLQMELSKPPHGRMRRLGESQHRWKENQGVLIFLLAGISFYPLRSPTVFLTGSSLGSNLDL